MINRKIKKSAAYFVLIVLALMLGNFNLCPPVQAAESGSAVVPAHAHAIGSPCGQMMTQDCINQSSQIATGSFRSGKTKNAVAPCCSDQEKLTKIDSPRKQGSYQLGLSDVSESSIFSDTQSFQGSSGSPSSDPPVPENKIIGSVFQKE